jgi:hypothetical protein
MKKLVYATTDKENRLDPDDLAEQVDSGGIDEYGIISQIDYM